MNICGRCDQPVRDGEEYTEHRIDSPSLGGTTVYLHLWCKRVEIQTAPASEIRRYH
nr:hypothetical protein [Streptomyces sp. S1D4-11]QIY95862.1 hypothetical protein HEP87_19775 [Streptomyces sp. S1D4-11]